MGIIILPFMIGAIIMIVISILSSVRLLNSGTVGVTEIVLGLIISLTISVIIIISYLIKKRIWGLSLYIRIPVFSIIIPYLVHIAIRNIDIQNVNYISNLLLISISFTGLLVIPFKYILNKLIEYFSIKIYY